MTQPSMSFVDYLDWLGKNQAFLAAKQRAVKKTPHPGQIIAEEYLFPRKISQTQLAKQLGCTHAKVNEVINGKRNVTVDFALDLERVLGVAADYWISLQMAFDLAKARTKRVKSDAFNY
jgi:addiction module HigA family antidote